MPPYLTRPPPPATTKTPPLKDGDTVKFLVFGAGYDGLLFAVRLVQAGFRVADIRLVDGAGGFGRTWYWNRYPGLMCDTESYIYMPLLEETGYMPKHRYAYGPELRRYAETIAEKWELRDKALFRTEVKRMEWDDAGKQWAVGLTENRDPGTKRDLSLRAQFIPKLSGLETFKGHHFHTSRWDYKYTGGSREEPALVNLKDKKIGIIGTGATAYVLPAYPIRATDPEWKRVATRMENFNSWVSNAPQGENLVDDGWCDMPSWSSLIGAPKYGISIMPEPIPEHVANMYALYAQRSSRVRARVEEIVKDKETAEKLKAWYPGWCKRPAFHDGYLPAFNQARVLDTDGKGVERVTERGIVANGQEYAHGFAAGSGSPARRANMVVVGRDGKDLDAKWLSGVATLHGCVTHDFPNFFFPGPSQAGAAANQVFMLGMLSTHVAHIVAEVEQRAEAAGFSRYAVEPLTEEGSMQIVHRAATFSALAGCTPGYLNKERQAARGGFWGEAYTRIIEAWREQGGLVGWVDYLLISFLMD
ncbi:hypothetical protein C8R44DRAFT_835126 [Mycena epipterygia]|nr:hypothetical protein C8R44DRAFT_835126 [Mycena epipterygia]